MSCNADQYYFTARRTCIVLVYIGLSLTVSCNVFSPASLRTTCYIKNILIFISYSILIVEMFSFQIQFLIIFVHNAAVFFYECNFPKVLNTLCLLNSTAFIYMFGKFYINSYKKNNEAKIVLDSKKEASISSKVKNSYGRRKPAEKAR